MNSLIYVYSIQNPSCFLGVLAHSRDHTSNYRRPKKFSLLPPVIFSFFEFKARACSYAAYRKNGTQDPMRTQDLMRTQGPRRNQDPRTTQDPMRTQDPWRTQDSSWTEDPRRIQDPYYPSC